VYLSGLLEFMLRITSLGRSFLCCQEYLVLLAQVFLKGLVVIATLLTSAVQDVTAWFRELPKIDRNLQDAENSARSESKSSLPGRTMEAFYKSSKCAICDMVCSQGK
jgi:hypothetical protein